MTEHEYVEHNLAIAEVLIRSLRGSAAAYIAAIEASERGAAIISPEIIAWSNAKANFSPWTMVVLCDAWLAQQSAEEPKT
jgi:hypothetical protein